MFVDVRTPPPPASVTTIPDSIPVGLTSDPTSKSDVTTALVPACLADFPEHNARQVLLHCRTRVSFLPQAEGHCTVPHGHILSLSGHLTSGPVVVPRLGCWE